MFTGFQGPEHSEFTSLLTTIGAKETIEEFELTTLRRSAGGFAVALLLLLVPASAFGESHSGSRTGPTTTTTTITDTTTTTVNPQKAYRQALATYIAARQAIAQTFKNEISAAKQQYESALSVATTGAQRSTARAAYALAVTQAAAQRSSSLTALGNPPTRPS
jgi:hypothetical protein